MPIEKVAVQHKFGIISHSQRLELQERLLKQSYLQTFGSKKVQTPSRNPLEVTDEFVQKFNSATSLEDREHLDEVARKLLQRIKRRAGLKDGGKGNHVDLPVAWTELSQLAQCKGQVQEECLDILIASLDQAPIQRTHIPALFFLAESTLYVLRTDSINQPYLRTAEVKLLKMGQLVFTRLFYHHMAGQLHGHKEFKSRLYNYLSGFADSQEAYNPYPNALLCIRYINEVGKMILADVVPDPGEIKEGDYVQGSEHGMSSQDDSQMFHEVSAHFEETKSSRSGAISSSVHDLSPTLWHALDVWRCINHLGGGLDQALKALAKCGLGLATESWIDGVCALYVLEDAARNNIDALRIMQNLARGLQPKDDECQNSHHHSTEHTATQGTTVSGSLQQDCDTVSSKVAGQQGLSDIYEKTEESQSQAVYSDHTETSKTIDISPQSQTTQTSSPYKVSEAKSGPAEGNSGRVAVSNSALAAEVGTEAGSGRASQASSVPTFTNAVYPELCGIQGWHWEVAFTYAEALADIALHGKTSRIQKVALVGNNKETADLHRQNTAVVPLNSAGLLDMVYFTAIKETYDNTANDWSWRVRYSAIQGLVKVCKCCEGVPTKEGLRTVAWNTLIKSLSLEKDPRVLEALKVGQVGASIEKLISEVVTVPPSAIGSKMANGLSGIYLPPLPPPVEVPVSINKPSTTRKSPLSTPGRQKPNKPLRTSLKEEIMLATALYEPPANFNTRTSFDLKRIVEDQWRKDLQKQLNDEEEERQNEIEERQKQEENLQEEIEQRRKEKLGSKYKGPAYVVQKSKQKPISEVS